MGIKLTPVAATGPVHLPRQRKPKYTNDDLPFAPQEYRDALKLWQTSVLGHIIYWAGSLDDPFAAGAAHPEYTAVVLTAWTKFFPEIAITDAVYAVVSPIRPFSEYSLLLL